MTTSVSSFSLPPLPSISNQRGKITTHSVSHYLNLFQKRFFPDFKEVCPEFLAVVHCPNGTTKQGTLSHLLTQKNIIIYGNKEEEVRANCLLAITQLYAESYKKNNAPKTRYNELFFQAEILVKHLKLFSVEKDVLLMKEYYQRSISY